MRRPPHKSWSGFTLIEVALAVGVMAFALLTLLALLPIGVKTNQTSAEETKAAGILTLLEADLRNTHPMKNSGKSGLYGLPLPYQLDPATGGMTINAALVDGALLTTGLDLAERPLAISALTRPRYQATVIYRLPPVGTIRPLEARLVVNWPAIVSAQTVIAADLVDRSKVGGYLEAVLSFPQP